MNNKIKEFEKQCTEYYSNGRIRGFDLDKFAELIVMECTNAVRDGTWEGDNYAARVEGVFGFNHPTITFRDEE